MARRTGRYANGRLAGLDFTLGAGSNANHSITVVGSVYAGMSFRGARNCFFCTVVFGHHGGGGHL
jgi:hypothetical protein